MEPVLYLENLSKSMDKKQILDGVSLSCYSGEVFGLLGPDGSGKTTLIRLITGLMKPDCGRISIGGHILETEFEQAMELVGAVVDLPAVYPSLTARKHLELIARIRKIENIKEAIDKTARTTGLTEFLDRKCRRVSLSFRQRLGAAMALIGNPPLLIFDEPSNGLDPAGIRQMRTELKRIAHEEGRCVVVASPLMSEAEAFCDRAAVLSKGRLIEVKTLVELMNRQNGGRSNYRFVLTPIEKARELLTSFRGGSVMAFSENSIDIMLTNEELTALNKYFIENGISLHTIIPIGERPLEEFYIDISKSRRNQDE